MTTDHATQLGGSSADDSDGISAVLDNSAAVKLRARQWADALSDLATKLDWSVDRDWAIKALEARRDLRPAYMDIATLARLNA